MIGETVNNSAPTELSTVPTMFNMLLIPDWARHTSGRVTKCMCFMGASFVGMTGMPIGLVVQTASLWVHAAASRFFGGNGLCQ